MLEGEKGPIGMTLLYVLIFISIEFLLADRQLKKVRDEILNALRHDKMNAEDEALREFESVANKTAIEREHAMEAAERTCVALRIEIEQWKQRAEKAEASR